jgi:creatinine amidohydrolase
MELKLLRWTDVEAHIAKTPTIILSCGSIEQHSPAGLLGTDMLCAEAVAREVGKQTGLLVGPNCPVGMAIHHTGFPGSMTLRPSTAIALVNDWLHSLYGHGFRRFFWVNGHGGNTATWAAAHSEFSANHPGSLFEFHNWWEVAETKAKVLELYGDREGHHATPSEIALTQHLYPEAFGREIDSKRDWQVDAHADVPWPMGPDMFRAHFPDGRMYSDPGLATAAHGKLFFDITVAALVKRAQALASRVMPRA